MDQLIVWGSPQQCRDHVQRYVDNGVTTPALAILPIPGIDLRQSLGAAQPLQGLGQPGTGDYLRPVGLGRGIGGICLRAGDIRAGQKAHGFTKRKAVLLRCALHLAEAIEHTLQVLAIDLHPTPAHECEAIGFRQ